MTDADRLEQIRRQIAMLTAEGCEIMQRSGFNEGVNRERARWTAAILGSLSDIFAELGSMVLEQQDTIDALTDHYRAEQVEHYLNPEPAGHTKYRIA